MSLHDRDARLEEAILAAARERLAADPPALGRTAAPGGRRAAGARSPPTGLGAERAAALLLDDVLLPSAIQIDHPRYLAFIPSAPRRRPSALADAAAAP